MRDWREVNEVLKPYTNVTNIHGHVHQVLYNEIGTMRSIGMLATSWPWPYAPEGVPKLTVPMIRADPGDIYDGVGWSTISMNNDKSRTSTSCGAARRSLPSFGAGLLAESAGDPAAADRRSDIPILREDGP